MLVSFDLVVLQDGQLVTNEFGGDSVVYHYDELLPPDAKTGYVR